MRYILSASCQGMSGCCKKPLMAGVRMAALFTWQHCVQVSRLHVRRGLFCFNRWAWVGFPLGTALSARVKQSDPACMAMEPTLLHRWCVCCICGCTARASTCVRDLLLVVPHVRGSCMVPLLVVPSVCASRVAARRWGLVVCLLLHVATCYAAIVSASGRCPLGTNEPLQSVYAAEALSLPFCWLALVSFGTACSCGAHAC